MDDRCGQQILKGQFVSGFLGYRIEARVRIEDLTGSSRRLWIDANKHLFSLARTRSRRDVVHPWLVSERNRNQLGEPSLQGHVVTRKNRDAAVARRLAFADDWRGREVAPQLIEHRTEVAWSKVLEPMN